MDATDLLRCISIRCSSQPSTHEMAWDSSTTASIASSCSSSQVKRNSTQIPYTTMAGTITMAVNSYIGSGMTAVSVLFTVFMNFLELLVAFIQAFVFTMLSSVFIGLSQQEHH